MREAASSWTQTLFSSTVIATVGRQSLGRAVESVLRQSLLTDAFEVIVVNDSGHELPSAGWQRDARVRLLRTHRRERSVARNAGAAIATGRYLHFLDDDDWLLPDALRRIWEMPKSDDVGWYYGVSQLVDRNGRPLIRLQHQLDGNCFTQVMAGEWIPLQSSFIRSSAFAAVGGFNQTLAGPEDIDLLRRIALQWNLAETQQPIACVTRGQAGTTTDYRSHPTASRRARELILSDPGAYARLHESAHTPGWLGRMARIFTTSAVWNLQHRRLTEALDRTWLLFLTLLVSGPALLSPAFWRSVVGPYASAAHSRGLDEERAESHRDQ